MSTQFRGADVASSSLSSRLTARGDRLKGRGGSEPGVLAGRQRLHDRTAERRPSARCEVVIVRILQDPELIKAGYSIISFDEKRRANKYRDERAANKFVLCRAVLRVLLASLVGRAPSSLRFVYGINGKPSLSADGAPRMHFSVTHSADIVAIALSPWQPIGVDIEKRRPLADYELIARTVLAPGEVRDLALTDRSTREGAFFDCWVRKEAYIKAIGASYARSLRAFRVSLRPRRRAELLEVSGQPFEPLFWTIRSFEPAADFSGAVAIRHHRAQVRARMASAEHLLSSDMMTSANVQPTREWDRLVWCDGERAE